jgi:iron complex outermembrane receptor protein
VSFGGEGRAVSGRVATRHLAHGDVLGTSTVDGSQHAGSAFVRAMFVLNDRLTVVAGTRGDMWYSESGETSTAQEDGSLGPRASFSYRLASSATLRGSMYRGFRAPTLNERYRGFRVGYNVTEPNEALRPETLTAGEGGLTFSHGRASARVTGFWNELHDVITNVTLSTSPWLTVRRRQNAGTLRSKGVEFEGAWRLPQSVFVGVTGALVDSRFAGDTRLARNFVPQVPAYSVGLTTRYDNGAWVVSGQLRITGPQFEDDVNSFMLRRVTVLDLLVSRTVARRVNAFFAVENVSDSDYDVGRTPTRTIGLPRASRAGIQLAW